MSPSRPLAVALRLRRAVHIRLLHFHFSFYFVPIFFIYTTFYSFLTQLRSSFPVRSHLLLLPSLVALIPLLVLQSHHFRSRKSTYQYIVLILKLATSPVLAFYTTTHGLCSSPELLERSVEFSHYITTPNRIVGLVFSSGRSILPHSASCMLAGKKPCPSLSIVYQNQKTGVSFCF